MGYTTEFEGEITINPPLSRKQVKEINTFCTTRHEGRTDVGISIWCDWEVDPRGDVLRWNGSEKSYKMEEWLEYLIGRFMSGHRLDGRLEAQGERYKDRWAIDVNDSVVTKLKGRVVYEKVS